MKTNVKRIGIAGSHSCGKTSLLHELSKHLPNYPIIEEIASLFPRATRKYMETQCAIMRAQIETEKRCKPLMVSDRTVMDNIAYTYLCFEESPKSDEDITLMEFNNERYLKHMKTHPYDLVIFVDECLPIEDNNSRCLNPFYQTLIYNRLKELTSLTRDLCDFEILYIKGSLNERMQTIISYLGTH